MPVPTPHLFLVVEFTGEGIAFAEFTRSHPGCTVDVISEPVVHEGAQRVHPSLFLVRRAPPGTLNGLDAQLTRLHGSVETVRRNDLIGMWLGRTRIREAGLRSATTAVLSAFQHKFGVPWTHVEGGVLYMRARVQDPAEAEVLLGQIKAYLRAAGADADVTLQEIGAQDYSVWDELVQASVGLAPA
jgi:hypothetical protein